MALCYSIGTRVKIKGDTGMKEFRNKTGEVIGHERDGQIMLNRVSLDKPVTIEGVGEVRDDLWSHEYLEELPRLGTRRPRRRPTRY